MSRVEPFQPAMQGGTKTATPIEKPAVLAALVRRAKRPLLVVGHRALVAGGDGEHAIDLLARAALKAGWPVVATGDTGPALAARGIEPALCISAMNLGQRLADPAWTGVDGTGPHDVRLPRRAQLRARVDPPLRPPARPGQPRHGLALARVRAPRLVLAPEPGLAGLAGADCRGLRPGGDGMIEGVPVDVGLVHEGERIRKQEMQVEFGGPGVGAKWELVRVVPPEAVEDGADPDRRPGHPRPRGGRKVPARHPGRGRGPRPRGGLRGDHRAPDPRGTRTTSRA